MSTTSIPLNYAPSDLPPRRHFYILLLPVLFLPASIGSLIYYGDEYISFVAVHFPALPVAALLQDKLPLRYLFITIMTLNLCILSFFGLILDRIRIRRRPVLLFPTLLVVAVPFCVPLNTRPYQNHYELFLTDFFPAWAAALYLFILAAMTITPLVRIFRRSS